MKQLHNVGCNRRGDRLASLESIVVAAPADCHLARDTDQPRPSLGTRQLRARTAHTRTKEILDATYSNNSWERPHERNAILTGIQRSPRLMSIACLLNVTFKTPLEFIQAQKRLPTRKAKISRFYFYVYLTVSLLLSIQFYYRML